MCRIVQGWFDLVKGSVHGTFLEYFDTPAKFVTKVSSCYFALDVMHSLDLRDQVPDSISFDEAATIPSGLATAVFPLYNPTGNEIFSSAKLLPPWVEGGRGKYAGMPILVIAGASSIGQFGLSMPPSETASPMLISRVRQSFSSPAFQASRPSSPPPPCTMPPS